MKIKEIKSFEILDSRGTPTIATLIETDNFLKEVGFVPSGASTGSREAIEKRDNGNSFNGMGVSQVIKTAEENLFPELIGMEIGMQEEFDSRMIELDGTKNKKNFGSNKKNHKYNIEFENELLIRRQINSNGKSKCFINDILITRNALSEITDCLVELQGQFEDRGLSNIKTHLSLLDIYSNHNHLIERTNESVSYTHLTLPTNREV